MSNCSSGCPTRDHRTYAECLRSKNSAVMGLESTGGSYSTQKAWDKELALYRSAKEQGIQPDTTKTKDIRRALDVSDATGTAYQGA